MTEAGMEAARALGERGEPCGGCGAPLAADQRYCLNCGRRRGEPRVDFREHLGAVNGATSSEARSPGPRASDEAEKPARDYGPLAAVGGIAVLGLMLLVGVLIGKGNGEEAAAPAPVVRVTGGVDGGEVATSGDSGESKANASKSAAKGKAKRGNGNQLTGGGKDPAAVTATDEDLKALQEQSPEDYQRASARLPDTIATPGAAPPTDNKAPGGGSGGGAVIR